MKNGITKLFVYGTLRGDIHHAGHQYIRKHFNIVAKAKVRGCLYDTGEYAAAVPTATNFFITGELYESKTPGEFRWAIEQLDDYEGVNRAEGEPQLYRRELTEVYCDENLTANAWIYWYNGNISQCPHIPSGDYVDTLKIHGKP